MGAGCGDAAFLHDEDHVGFLHGRDALGDDDLRGVGDLVMECGADQLVGLGVNGRGGVVENQDLRLLQERASDAQALALAAGDVGAALFDVRVVLVRELLDEAVGLRELAGVADLLVGGVRVAPAQVLGDGSGEQHVLLQHHGDLVAQDLHVVVAHVDAADLERTVGHIVQSRHELHQAGLRRTGAADDADGHAGTDLQVDIVEHRLFGVIRVAEVDVVEFDGPVGHFLDGVGRVGHRAFLVEHLADTFRGRLGNDAHDEDHGQHHHGHEDLHGVGDQCGQVAGGEPQRGIIARGHDLLGAHPCDENHRDVYADHHERVVEAHHTVGLAEVLVDALGDAAEFGDFMRFAGVGLDHADALKVLVDHVVELVVGVEHALEHRVHVHRQAAQTEGENRDARQEHQGNGRADAEREDPRHDHHDRGSHTQTNDHGIGVLQVGHIGGEPGDDRAGGELVNIGEAEALHLLEFVMTQVLGESSAGDRGELTGKEASRERT